ncbi:sodium:proton antiporter [Fusibacter tunisiensis]|uniref:Multicomponent Na+:H+ antiporter subunit C n=1 Tax=Fusibacter tunisiensis TaxID=1008308 RepID=A0ABS2MS21_9FIRM|nr:cation:proton antiporter subunit C [Fusibacter tunisiensis]MBM7562213.1 multicomponent Na+:H+ antiporter subunit C [Fusibacter tunisiensis]
MISKIISPENVSIVLFFIGVYGVTARRNIFKTIMGLSIMQAALILFFLSMHAENAISAPIGIGLDATQIADPVPQALMITAIVVGISTTAVSLTMFVTLYHKYGTTNWNKVKKKRGEMD